MELNEIIGLIPADKQELVKTELGQYVRIDGRDAAEKLAKEHPHIKSVVDSYISKAVASHDERFMAEKLPSIVDAEILKKNPPKDPRDQKIIEMENKFKELERAASIKDQTALAVTLASEKGIPVELVKKWIGNNDDETRTNIEMLSGVLKPWKDEAIKQGLVERLGNGSAPKVGATPDQLAQMRVEHARLMNSKDFVKAQILLEQIRQMEKTK